MKLKITRWFLPSLFAVFLILFFVTPVLADINEPDSMSLNGVYAYQNCQETGDQLYIVDYTITYTVAPDEDVTEAYLVRLMNGATELGSVAPYAYYNYGYDRGVAAIYFSSADAPTWEGNYTMTLEGNPMFTWNVSRPYISVSDFSVWQDNPIETTQVVLSSRVLWLADQLELAWSVDMIETAQSGSYLTSYGEDYFGNVIPDLSVLAPFVYSTGTITPTIPPIVSNATYEETIYQTYIKDTPSDMTDVADIFNLQRNVVATLIYYGAGIIIAILMCQALNTYKPLMIILLVFVAIGPLLGASVWVTVVTGCLAGLLTAFEVLYKPSGG